MGLWFPKRTRGAVVGFWATCNNFGNIAGIQMAAFLLTQFNGEWQYLMIIASGLAALLALITFFFLIPNPIEVGIIVEEMTE